MLGDIFTNCENCNPLVIDHYKYNFEFVNIYYLLFVFVFVLYP